MGSAEKITNRAVDQLNADKSSVQANKDAFTGAVNTGKSSYANYDPNFVTDALGNPTTFTQDPNKVKTFQDYLHASYAGPNSVNDTQDFTNASNTAAKAKATADQFKTAEGQKAAVQGQLKAPTPGKANLDTALIQSSPEAREKFNALKPFNSEFDTALSDFSATGNAAADAAKAQAAQVQGATGSALDKTYSDFETGVNKSVAQKQQELAGQNTAIQAAVKGRNLTPEQLAQLGVSPEEWSQIQNLLKDVETSRVMSDRNATVGTGAITDFDMSQYLQQLDPAAQVSAANYATPEQYDLESALEKLKGGDYSLLNEGDRTKAGTAPTNLNTFNKQDLIGNLTGIRDSQDAAAKEYMAAINEGLDEEHAIARAKNAVQNAAMSTMIGAPTALIGKYVGGDVGKYANQFTNVVGQNTLKAQEAAKKAASDVASAAASSGPTGSGAGNTALNVATMGMSGQVSKAVNTVKNIVCFDPLTLIEMSDGSYRAIKDIVLGDFVRGGTVEAIQTAYSDHMNVYKGVSVTDYHAVKEDGVWMRIKDSMLTSSRHEGKHLTYNLVTSEHRIYSHGIEFADLHETDDYESLSMEQSLNALNSKCYLAVR